MLFCPDLIVQPQKCKKELMAKLEFESRTFSPVRAGEETRYQLRHFAKDDRGARHLSLFDVSPHVRTGLNILSTASRVLSDTRSTQKLGRG